MICKKCGYENAPDSKFCQKCGAVLESVPDETKLFNICPHCGAKIDSGMKFCRNCGLRLENLPAAETKPVQPSAFCPNCGAKTEAGMKFCQVCGFNLEKTHSADQTEKKTHESAPDPSVQEFPNQPLKQVKKENINAGNPDNKKTKAKKTGRKGAVISVVCLVLAAVILITGFWQPGFFIGRNRTVSKKLSGTDAFRIDPYPGLTVSAEENALDKNREFKVLKYSEEELDRLTLDTVKQGYLPYTAFDIDAGMNDDTVIPGTFRVSFDMNQFDVPRELYGDMAILRQDSDGYYCLMNTSLDGDTIYAESDHNSLFICGLAVGTSSAYLIKDYFIDGGVPSDDYTKYTVKCESGTTYNLIVPDSKTGERTDEYTRMCEKEQEIIKKYTEDVKDAMLGEASKSFIYSVINRVVINNIDVKGVDKAGPAAARELEKFLAKDKDWQKLK